MTSDILSMTNLTARSRSSKITFMFYPVRTDGFSSVSLLLCIKWYSAQKCFEYIKTLPLIICYHACPCGMQPYGVHYATMHKCRKALAGTRHCYYLLGLFTYYVRKFSIILFPLDTVTLSQTIGAIICFSTNLLSLPTSYVNVL